MICPYTRVRQIDQATMASDREETHKLKFKDLITLKLAYDESTNEFNCEICRKKLGHQKIVALRKCGHVMCSSCCYRFVFPSNSANKGKKGQCPSCTTEIRDPIKGVIKLHESGSAFASHSKVEATIYKPAFKS